MSSLVKPKGNLLKVFVYNKGDVIVDDEGKRNKAYDRTEVVYIYRDENGEKKAIFDLDPKVKFYIAKDLNDVELYRDFIPKNKVEEFQCSPDDLYEEIIKHSKKANEYYNRLLELKNKKRISASEVNIYKQNIHKIPGIYSSDMSLEHQYYFKFYETFEPNEHYIIKKAFFDIENDLMPDGKKKNTSKIDPTDPKSPVNLISLFYENVLYVFVLKYNEENNGCKNNSYLKFINQLYQDKINNSNKYKQDLIKRIVERNYDPENEPIEIDDVKIRLFNNEYELIKTFFATVHQLDPDFIIAWNAGYDIQTLVNRLSLPSVMKHGLPRVDGVSDDDYEKACKYKARTIIADYKYYKDFTKVAQRHEENQAGIAPNWYYRNDKGDKGKTDPAWKKEYFTVCDGINWIDLMATFARYSAGSKRDSYSLDSIAKEELNLSKLDLSEHNVDIYTAPWYNFGIFFEYNLQDTVLLSVLERRFQNCELLQSMSQMMISPINILPSQSKYLTNALINEGLKDGLIASNNLNTKYEKFEDNEGLETAYFNKTYLPSFEDKVKEAFKNNEFSEHVKKTILKVDKYGGVAGDPMRNTNKNGDIVLGEKSFYLYSFVFDLDFKSLYPSVAISHNIDRSTFTSQLFLYDQKVYDKFKIDGYNGVFQLSKKTKNYWDIEYNSKGEIKEVNVIENDPNMALYLVDFLHSNDYAEIGSMFYSLPTTEELINELIE